MTSALSATGSVWNNYLDLDDDVKPWLRLTSINGALPDPIVDNNLELITTMACDAIQNILGRPIPPTIFDRRFDGWSSWNGAFLMLPYYPVLEITSVIEYWGTSGPRVLTESTPTNQTDGWQCEYAVGRLTRVFPGLVQKPWFPGSRNVEIVWTAGYNPIPGRFRVATLELIKHWWVNTQQQPTVSMAPPGSGAGNQYDPAETGGPFDGIPYHVAAMIGDDIQVGIG